MKYGGKNLGGSDIPVIKYHQKCRSLFRLKRDLQKLNSENDKTFSPTLSNNRNNRVIEILLHLNEENHKISFTLHVLSTKKGFKGTETKEKLNLCVKLRADKSIKEALCINDLTVNQTCPS